jgi:hypothetical protein
VLQGRSPQQIVQLASAHLGDQSYRMTLDGSVRFDASGVRGLPGDAAGALTGMPEMHFTGTADVQSARRVRFVGHVAMAGIDKSFSAILYDGQYYVSSNNDGRYADAGTISFNGLSFAPSDIAKELSGLGVMRDAGAAVHDGVRTEHLQATLNRTFLSDLFSRATGTGAVGSGLGQLARLFAEAVDISAGTADLFVRSADGLLEADDFTADFSVDMARLAHLLISELGAKVPGDSRIGDINGTLRATETSSTRFSDYGAHITVSKPTVDPNAPGLPSNLFGGGM